MPKIKDIAFEQVRKFEKLKDQYLQEKFSVGVDSGISSVKVVVLKGLRPKPEFCKLDIFPAKADLKTHLTQFLQPFNITKVNIALSGPATLIRYVPFPKMSDSELQNALKFEAQKHIPFNLDDVIVDSFIVNQNLPDNKMLVLLVAAKKEAVQQQIRYIETMGLEVKGIDIDSVALMNAFNFNYGQEIAEMKYKSVALLNMGAAETNVNILESGMPCLSRDVHIGGNILTKRLSDVFGVDFSEAEHLKYSMPQEKAEKARVAFESAVNSLAQEIRSSFDYYESQSTSSVERIFLSGGGSLGMGLKDMLQTFLNIPVEVWNPFSKIFVSGDSKDERIEMLSCQFGVAVGLALRS